MSIIDAIAVYTGRAEYMAQLDMKLKEFNGILTDFSGLAQKLKSTIEGKLRIDMPEVSVNDEKEFKDYISFLQGSLHELCSEFKEGSEVVISEPRIDDWNRTYFDERNANFPIGTKGRIKNFVHNIQIEFDKNKCYRWSIDWGYLHDEGSNVGQFHQSELKPISKLALQEVLKQYEGKGDPMKLFIEDMYSEDLQMREYYITARERFFSEAITKLKEYGFSYKEVSEYFRKRLGYNDDFEKILIRSAEGEKNA